MRGGVLSPAGTPPNLPNKSGPQLHLARLTEAGPDRAVEVEDQVRVLRNQEVGAVEHVEDLDDGLQRRGLPELELAGEAQVERRERVVLAPRVPRDDRAVGPDPVGAGP